jgi:hypothetical protein
MVDAGEVDHLEGERLLAKVIQLAEGDVEPNTPEGTTSFLRTIP